MLQSPSTRRRANACRFWSAAASGAYIPGKFDTHTIKPGEALPSDYSNTGLGPYGTFTIPVSEAQANRTCGNRADQPIWYGIQRPRFEVLLDGCQSDHAGCRTGQPALCGSASELRISIRRCGHACPDPRAQIARRTGVPIPASLRRIQQDYAYVGGGYDTPPERLRFGPASREGSRTQQPDQPANVSAPRPIRYLSGRHTTFEDSAQSPNPVPFGELRRSNDGADFDEAVRWSANINAASDRNVSSRCHPGLHSHPESAGRHCLFGVDFRGRRTGGAVRSEERATRSRSGAHTFERSRTWIPRLPHR